MGCANDAGGMAKKRNRGEADLPDVPVPAKAPRGPDLPVVPVPASEGVPCAFHDNIYQTVRMDGEKIKEVMAWIVQTNADRTRTVVHRGTYLKEQGIEEQQSARRVSQHGAT